MLIEFRVAVDLRDYAHIYPRRWTASLATLRKEYVASEKRDWDEQVPMRRRPFLRTSLITRINCKSGRDLT